MVVAIQADSGRCRRRRRCPASRRCRSPPTLLPSRTSPWPASCCRRIPSSPARGDGDSGRFGHVGKRAVATVAIEDVRAAREPLRPAGDRNIVVATVGRLARPRRLRGIEIHIAGDEQIQMTVAVIVQKTAARAPAGPRSRDAGFFRDIRKRPIAVVAVEHVLPPVRDEQIVEAVVVVVADTTRLPPAGVGQPRLLRDIGECAVAVVVKQVTGRLAVPHFRVEAAAVHQKDVEPAVVVVVEERRAAAHFLEQELLVGRAAGHVPGLQQAGRGGDVREDNRTASAQADRRSLARRRTGRPCPEQLAEVKSRRQRCRRPAPSTRKNPPT